MLFGKEATASRPSGNVLGILLVGVDDRFDALVCVMRVDGDAAGSSTVEGDSVRGMFRVRFVEWPVCMIGRIGTDYRL